MAFTRAEVREKLQKEIEKGNSVVGAGAGTGISAKFAQKGGVDLIIIYNSGRYRMAGRGSLAGLLPYGDANGVCGTDPFRLMDKFLAKLKDMGFSGVQNFPTVGLIDGVFRQNLEETGMGYDLEVEMIRKAHELDMFTAPYVFSEEDAKAMAEAGADVLVAHMGLTTSGSIGAETALTLEESAKKVQRIADAGKSVNPDVMVICHGGPIAMPDDAKYVLENTENVVGFFGASSIERLPTETAIRKQTEEFKKIKTK
jgi:predicted TIM-barrel enzyme